MPDRPSHAHIRDELEAVIRRTLNEAHAVADRELDGTRSRLIADRCVHVLALLDALPEETR